MAARRASRRGGQFRLRPLKFPRGRTVLRDARIILYALGLNLLQHVLSTRRFNRHGRRRGLRWRLLSICGQCSHTNEDGTEKQDEFPHHACSKIFSPEARLRF
jgi:hypothetical protein